MEPHHAIVFAQILLTTSIQESLEILEITVFLALKIITAQDVVLIKISNSLSVLNVLQVTSSLLTKDALQVVKTLDTTFLSTYLE